jgi:hypothetical protein
MTAVATPDAGWFPPGRGGASHQLTIVPTPDLRQVAVSCTCLAEPIGARARWEGGEAYKAWLAHLEAEAEPEAGP